MVKFLPVMLCSQFNKLVLLLDRQNTGQALPEVKAGGETGKNPSKRFMYILSIKRNKTIHTKSSLKHFPPQSLIILIDKFGK